MQIHAVIGVSWQLLSEAKRSISRKNFAGRRSLENLYGVLPIENIYGAGTDFSLSLCVLRSQWPDQWPTVGGGGFRPPAFFPRASSFPGEAAVVKRRSCGRVQPDRKIGLPVVFNPCRADTEAGVRAESTGLGEISEMV